MGRPRFTSTRTPPCATQTQKGLCCGSHPSRICKAGSSSQGKLPTSSLEWQWMGCDEQPYQEMPMGHPGPRPSTLPYLINSLINPPETSPALIAPLQSSQLGSLESCVLKGQHRGRAARGGPLESFTYPAALPGQCHPLRRGRKVRLILQPHRVGILHTGVYGDTANRWGDKTLRHAMSQLFGGAPARFLTWKVL